MDFKDLRVAQNKFLKSSQYLPAKHGLRGLEMGGNLVNSYLLDL
jgi:hypothetical protein